MASSTDGETLRGRGLGGGCGASLAAALSIIATAGELFLDRGRGWTGGMTLGLPGTFGGTLIAGAGGSGL